MNRRGARCRNIITQGNKVITQSCVTVQKKHMYISSSNFYAISKSLEDKFDGLYPAKEQTENKPFYGSPNLMAK